MHPMLKSNMFTPLIIFILIIGCLPVFGQIDVTINFNSSTNRDTLMEHHQVQLRGESTGDVVPAITWGDDSGIILDSVGGDYWQTTIQMNTGDTLKYKFWTGFDLTTGTFFWGGWEGPLNDVHGVGSGDRYVIAGANDTTLALQFYNGNETGLDEYWRPYEEKEDSFVVFLRVNMAGKIEDESFDPDSDEPVIVRGGAPLDPADAWALDIVLEQEDPISESLESTFYSGAAHITNLDLTPGMEQNFKYVYRDASVWESTPNRTFTYSGPTDTTIHWVYYDNQAPTGLTLVDADLVWRLKTDGLEKLGLFDGDLDKVVIDGATAWDVDNAIQLVYTPLSQEWIGQEAFKKQPGATFEYKAVIRFDSTRQNSESENYISGLDVLDYWEEPSTFGTGNRTYTYTSEATQYMPGDHGFDFQYFNGLPPEGVIETDITVTFNVNMAPAMDEGTNPSNPLYVAGDSVWILLYGCLMPLTQGQALYAEDGQVVLKDLDGDNIYSGSLALTAPTVFDAGFRVRYKEPTGSIIENGGGNSLGRSYYQYIQPDDVHSDGTIDWPSEFSFEVVDWNDSDLPVEPVADVWTITSIDQDKDRMAHTFELSQNYPNPFNPITTIGYQVAHKSHVKIKVYNISGQLITILVNTEMPAGKYSVQWSGKDINAKQAVSGVYFLKMEAGDFQNVIKLMLLK